MGWDAMGPGIVFRRANTEKLFILRTVYRLFVLLLLLPWLFSHQSKLKFHNKMNGVELPCGTTLRVEPSLSNKKTKIKKASLLQCDELSSEIPSKEMRSETSNPETEVNDSKDEDLDDFFASL